MSWLAREAIRFINKVRADGCTGHAAMIAYNFFLALPVAIIFIVSLLGIIPYINVTASLLDQLSGVLPQEVLDFIESTVDEALSRGESIFLISLVGTAYVLSNAYAGLIASLNAVYESREERPWLHVRFRALLLSIFATLLLIAAFILILVTPAAVEYLQDKTGLSEGTAVLLTRIRWPVILILAFLAIESTYRYGPYDGPRWRIVSPGSVISTVGWVLVTLVFGVYVNNYAAYDRIYGTLTTVVVLLVWLWMSAMNFLIGAEINMLWRRLSRNRHAAAVRQSTVAEPEPPDDTIEFPAAPPVQAAGVGQDAATERADGLPPAPEDV